MDQLSGKLNRGSNGRLIAETIDDYNTKGQLPVFKQKMEVALMEIVRRQATILSDWVPSSVICSAGLPKQKLYA
jgi:hypothetical protein